MVCTYVRDAIFIHWSPLSGAYGNIYSTHRRQSMKYGFRNPSCVNLDNPKRSNVKLNVLKVKQNADLENVFHFLTNALVGKGQFYQRQYVHEWTRISVVVRIVQR